MADQCPCRTKPWAGRAGGHRASHARQFQELHRRAVSAPTPLLDFFKRGEVARDVRLLAATGALAPRAHEQLSILVLLLDDADPEVRTTAQTTIDRIPVEAL